jgi:hypothetical protein
MELVSGMSYGASDHSITTFLVREKKNIRREFVPPPPEKNGGTVSKHILITAKLKTGKRGQEQS